jgi:hypothetical protein
VRGEGVGSAEGRSVSTARKMVLLACAACGATSANIVESGGPDRYCPGCERDIYRDSFSEMAAVCEGDARSAWLACARLSDEQIDSLPAISAISDRGWTAEQILAHVERAKRSARASSVVHAKTRGEGKKTKDLRRAILDILDSIDGTMSSRQIFYQCVSSGVVANTKAECLRVGRLLVKMRRDGSIAYSRIVDRTRSRHVRPSWEGVEDVLDVVATQFRRDFWSGLAAHTVPMIACEKQALEGIFQEAVDAYGAELFVLRGYGSESFEYEWSERIKAHTNEGRDVVIYYFGDHDPSGLNIEETSRKKLEGFGAEFVWERAGLVHDDFDTFDLVNIPVKRTDSRAKSYLSQFGDRAAELDALRPDELRDRIQGCIEAHINPDAWERHVRGDEAGRAELRTVAAHWEAALQGARGAA